MNVLRYWLPLPTNKGGEVRVAAKSEAGSNFFFFDSLVMSARGLKEFTRVSKRVTSGLIAPHTRKGNGFYRAIEARPYCRP